jgi:hypothetical protein
MQRSVFHGKLQRTPPVGQINAKSSLWFRRFRLHQSYASAQEQALSQQGRETLASIAQSGSCGFHAALAASTEAPAPAQTGYPSSKSDMPTETGPLARPGDEPGAAPSFGLPTANSLRSMVDSRAKRPRQVRRGRSRQRYRRACTRRLLYLFRGGARPASGYETADTRTRRCASLQYRECNLSCFRIVANR